MGDDLNGLVEKLSNTKLFGDDTIGEAISWDLYKRDGIECRTAHRAAIDQECIRIIRESGIADEIETLKQRLEFAEFEWNRTTAGMQERDADISHLRRALAEIAAIDPDDPTAANRMQRIAYEAISIAEQMSRIKARVSHGFGV